MTGSGAWASSRTTSAKAENEKGNSASRSSPFFMTKAASDLKSMRYSENQPLSTRIWSEPAPAPWPSKTPRASPRSLAPETVTL